MAIDLTGEGTATIGVTEWSLPRNASYSSASPQTADCIIQVFIDTLNMGSGDEFEIRIYEKVKAAGTQRETLQANLNGPQSQPFVSPSLLLGNGWDVTIQKVSGTDRSFDWSLRKVS